MQQFYKNVVDSKFSDTKLSFLRLTKWSFLARNALTKSEVYFSVEIDFNIYREGMDGTFEVFKRLFCAHM